jgi:alginate O-acetyltransferase complex protein AlgI
MDLVTHCCIGYYLSFIPVFILLLIGLTVINYFLAKWLAKIPEERNRVLFIVAILVNLIVLSFFKYFNILFPVIKYIYTV